MNNGGIMTQSAHRSTLVVEQACILAHDAFAGAQYVLRVQAPEQAARAQPGQFVHLQVAPQLPLRRPLSIMRVSAQAGWLEFLYKAVGEGTRLLAQRQVGEVLDMLGPIGRPFQVRQSRPVLIGGGVGMPPMIFLAESLRRSPQQPLVVLGSEVPFPFQARPSQIMVPGVPPEVIGAMPLLEDWGIASRLASLQAYPGCFQGYVTQLVRHWLDGLTPEQRQDVGLYACGPEPMLQAVTRLAAEYQLPVQVSLEEYMACATGGCAGCAVPVHGEGGMTMQRVCVDGPIFDGHTIYPEIPPEAPRV
jgi:dihydroorotate dehydrogenase electron transfer subunit